MDKNPRLVARLFAIVLFPFIVAGLVPLVLVFAALFYVNVLVRAVLHVVMALVQRATPPPAAPLSQSHFRAVPTAGIAPE